MRVSRQVDRRTLDFRQGVVWTSVTFYLRDSTRGPDHTDMVARRWPALLDQAGQRKGWRDNIPIPIKENETLNWLASGLIRSA